MNGWAGGRGLVEMMAEGCESAVGEGQGGLMAGGGLY